MKSWQSTSDPECLLKSGWMDISTLVLFVTSNMYWWLMIVSPSKKKDPLLETVFQFLDPNSFSGEEDPESVALLFFLI